MKEIPEHNLACKCTPNYEQEYYTHIREIDKLKKENRELKNTLIGMCKAFFDTDEVDNGKND